MPAPKNSWNVRQHLASIPTGIRKKPNQKGFFESRKLGMGSWKRKITVRGKFMWTQFQIRNSQCTGKCTRGLSGIPYKSHGGVDQQSIPNLHEEKFRRIQERFQIHLRLFAKKLFPCLQEKRKRSGRGSGSSAVTASRTTTTQTTRPPPPPPRTTRSSLHQKGGNI